MPSAQNDAVSASAMTSQGAGAGKRVVSDLTPPLAQRLKEARLRSGMSQATLGMAAGMDIFSASPRLNQYERGKRAPDYRTAERLASALGCPVSFFFIRENDIAEMMLAIHRLPADQRRQLHEQLQEKCSNVISMTATRR